MKNPVRRCLSSSTLCSDPVRNAAGEDLGSVRDLMIDLQTGRIAYVVLSFGGFLGMGDKLFAVPWGAVSVDSQDKCLRLNVDSERLREAPGFDKNHWPDFADPAFQSLTHDFYGVKPF